MSESKRDEAIVEEHSVHTGDLDSKGRRVSPWAWVPSVYFAQGLQYAIVIQLFVIIFFTMGLPLSTTLFWVGMLQLPWTIKPLWGPLVDKYWTKRGWTYTMQMLVGACFVGTAFCLLIPGTAFLYPALIFLFGLAIAAATHDIACDGYYMMGLNEKQQAFYVGIRSTVFRAALIFANAILIWIAGLIQTSTGLPRQTADLNVTPAAEVAEAASLTTEEFFAAEEWPESAEQAILIMPKALEATAGEDSFITVRLAQEPAVDETEVVTLNLGSGSEGIKFPRDFERIEFNQENWSQGVNIPISSDEQTRTSVSDSIEAQAGNIPLSWWVVCLICGAFYLVVFIYHKFVLPHPASDTSDTSKKPFFLIPVVLLAVTIGLPWGIGYGIYWGLGKAGPAIQEKTIGAVKYDGLQDLQEFVISEPDEPAPVDASDLMAVIERIRATDLTASASELQKILDLRETLQSGNVLNDPDRIEKIYTVIDRKRNDPYFYGSPRLTKLLIQIKGLNDDELPETIDELETIISKAESPLFDEMPENSEQLLGALTAIEKIEKDMAGEDEAEETAAVPTTEEEIEDVAAASMEETEPLTTTEEETDEIAAASAEETDPLPTSEEEVGDDIAMTVEETDSLPKSEQEIGEIIALSKATPTPLEVKGFDFFFAAGRLILLLIIGGLLLWVPALWSLPRKFFYLMSDWSEIGFAEVFGTFFGKAGMGITIGFLLTFRLGEAQLAQVKNPFLIATRDTGGLAMSLGELAFTNGVVYLAALTIGGILGGVMIARYGLKSTIWPMVAFMHLPNLLYIWLAYQQPVELLPVNVIVGFESFGYGLGFTAYLMIMILAAQGNYKTAHYALCTGAMALGYMIPGMWSGYLQELVGYPVFFVLVIAFTLPGVILIPFLKIDPEFGKKSRRA